jgi:hypothetical protein
MDNNKPAQDKAQTAIDHATKVREGANEQHRRRQAGDPYLIPDGKLKRCSVCGFPFPEDAKPSMSVAFAEHLMKVHQSGQTSEDFSQAPVRVVRESPERD